MQGLWWRGELVFGREQRAGRGAGLCGGRVDWLARTRAWWPRAEREDWAAEGCGRQNVDPLEEDDELLLLFFTELAHGRLKNHQIGSKIDGIWRRKFGEV
jgi:hypothetical protein